MNTFLDLQQKAAEVMAAITTWESELNGIQRGFKKVNKKEKSFVKKNVGPLYK